MSKSQTLRALVKERLTAAADEICVLFERTIAEYEVELCRSNEENKRKQLLLDSTLNPRVPLHKVEAGALLHSQGPGMNHEITETPEQLPEPVPEILFCVKTEPSLLKEEPKEEEDISPGLQFLLNTEDTWNSSDTDNSEHWGPAFSFSASQMDNLSSAFKSSHGISATVNKRPTSGTDEGAGRTFPDSEITFQCSVCQKRFGSKADLQSHDRVHTGERPFSCPTCQRAFKQKCHLAMHLKRHTGEKPYSCPICKEAFVTRGALKSRIPNRSVLSVNGLLSALDSAACPASSRVDKDLQFIENWL
uniref:C2H2-type domain-containing protein n=1 Tax=Neogobius melanostomus TaxID=47308 RepID=A0A8C6V5I8_9GOBI